MKRVTLGEISGMLVTVVAVSLVLAGLALAQDSPKGLYKIHNNLGRTQDGLCFSRSEGWVVGGGQSIAMPFTPKADAKLTVMTIGLVHCLYGCGPNQGIVTLSEDSNGLPGNTIYSWKFQNVDFFVWRGCYLTGAKLKKGVGLKKGSQYWLVALSYDDATNAWAYTWNNTQGSFAYDENNSGWVPVYGYLGAFGLFGKELK